MPRTRSIKTYSRSLHPCNQKGSEKVSDLFDKICFASNTDDGLKKASGNLPLPYFSPDDNTSIEMMRHEIAIRKEFTRDWNVWDKDVGNSYNPSLSLSLLEAGNCSCVSSELCSDCQEKTSSPQNIRQQSFKIKNSNQVASHCVAVSDVGQVLHCEAEKYEAPEGSDKSSNYTSVYTWTTATSTLTSAQTDFEKKYSPLRQKQKDSSSPTLELNLDKTSPYSVKHSTAIQHDSVISHLHMIPQLSPVQCPKESLIAEKRSYTQQPATRKFLSQCPHKMKSFVRMHPHKSPPPKCSTMLFHSMAFDGEDSLNVSSIQNAPLDIQHLHRENGSHKMSVVKDKLKSTSSSGAVNKVLTSTPCKTGRNTNLYCANSSDAVNKVLTSTPCKSGRNASLYLNLSSLHATPQDDELHPMQTSEDVVNSQEIVACTLSCASFEEPASQIIEQTESRRNDRHGPVVKAQEIIANNLLDISDTHSSFLKALSKDCKTTDKLKKFSGREFVHTEFNQALNSVLVKCKDKSKHESNFNMKSDVTMNCSDSKHNKYFESDDCVSDKNDEQTHQTLVCSANTQKTRSYPLFSKYRYRPSQSRRGIMLARRKRKGKQSHSVKGLKVNIWSQNPQTEEYEQSCNDVSKAWYCPKEIIIQQPLIINKKNSSVHYYADEFEACPISMLGMPGQTHRSATHKPRLLLWIESKCNIPDIAKKTLPGPSLWNFGLKNSNHVKFKRDHKSTFIVSQDTTKRICFKRDL